MIDALYISATGMNAQQRQLEAIANNMVNANTNGYKKTKVQFVEILRRLTPPETTDSGNPANSLDHASAGVLVSSVGKLFDQGEIKKTDSAFDIAINGDGFLELTLADGSRAYTRGGTLKVNADGMLVTQSGYLLGGGISMPSDMTRMIVQPDGKVQVETNSSMLNDLAQLDLVRFTNPERLIPVSDGVYASSAASGEAILTKPGEAGAGWLMQGAVEGSNVRMVDELVSLMVAQRAYEGNIKIAQAADEMLGMINGLRK